MFSNVWIYVQDSAHRETLGWIGGGAITVIYGLWAVFKFFAREGKAKPPAPQPQIISADRGGQAAGRDINIGSQNKR